MSRDRTRRAFLRDLAMYGGAVSMAGYISEPLARAFQGTATTDWKEHVGLELFTVRDAMTAGKPYEDTLAKLAAIGYKEVEPANGYNGMEPKAFRAMLDRYGLSMPSTHSGATGATQAEVEHVLDGFQIMGIKYTEISIGPGRGGGRGGRGGPGAAGRGGPGGRGRGGPGRGFGAPQPPQSVDSVKQRAAALNADGRIAARFGMKILVHNHAQEFNLLDDGKTTTYDVLLAETDPSLVAMQLDIGWASVAGQDILGMFRKTPGRFELWHVKDIAHLADLDGTLQPGQRMGQAMLVPVGLGDVDYKTIFENARLAGLKHFCIEQDNAAAWGDSVAAARVSYENLTSRVLA